MLDKKTLMLAAGGLALGAVAVIAVGLTVHRQASRLRSHMRTVSRGIYHFGSALQLLSGAAAQDECDCCSEC